MSADRDVRWRRLEWSRTSQPVLHETPFGARRILGYFSELLGKKILGRIDPGDFHIAEADGNWVGLAYIIPGKGWHHDARGDSPTSIPSEMIVHLEVVVGNDSSLQQATLDSLLHYVRERVDLVGCVQSNSVWLEVFANRHEFGLSRDGLRLRGFNGKDD